MPVSLYQLALATQPAPQRLSVSPASLKSLLGATIDVLIEQKIASELWVKLPPGQVWQAEIERLQDLAVSRHTIYLCNATQQQREGLLSDEESEIVHVQLEGESEKDREYFVLAVSDKFCGLILARRTSGSKKEPGGAMGAQKSCFDSDDMSIRVSQTGRKPAVFSDVAAPFEVEASPAGLLLEDEVIPKKKPSLIALCAFERFAVQGVLEGIKRAISQGGSLGDKAGIGEPSDRDCSVVMLTQLLAKQIQRHDEIRRNAVKIQKGDRSTEVLAQQNESLLHDLHLKDEFLSHVATELRTPLTNMKTALTLLGSAQLKPAQRQRYMQMLNRECDRQGSLITGLLELMQLERTPQPAQVQPVHLIDIVPAVVSTYQPLAGEKGVQLGYTVSTALPYVSCPEPWLRQIVINLLHNSIKFTPPGGQVWVRSKQQGEYVQIEFRDTGMGIAAGEIPKIFDRFYRGRPASSEDVPGAGLGLTIVQQLLLRCGGSVSVTSRLGEGSTFKVLLPVDQTKQKAP